MAVRLRDAKIKVVVDTAGAEREAEQAERARDRARDRTEEARRRREERGGRGARGGRTTIIGGGRIGAAAIKALIFGAVLETVQQVAGATAGAIRPDKVPDGFPTSMADLKALLDEQRADVLAEVARTIGEIKGQVTAVFRAIGGAKDFARAQILLEGKADPGDVADFFKAQRRLALGQSRLEAERDQLTREIVGKVLSDEMKKALQGGSHK